MACAPRPEAVADERLQDKLRRVNVGLKPMWCTWSCFACRTGHCCVPLFGSHFCAVFPESFAQHRATAAAGGQLDAGRGWTWLARAKRFTRVWLRGPAQVKTIAQELGVGFLGLGFDPLWRLEDVPVMPKARYQIMRSYMPTRGDLGLDMMFRSCTIQARVRGCGAPCGAGVSERRRAPSGAPPALPRPAHAFAQPAARSTGAGARPAGRCTPTANGSCLCKCGLDIRRVDGAFVGARGACVHSCWRLGAAHCQRGAMSGFVCVCEGGGGEQWSSGATQGTLRGAG
jgi:Glutamate-cysteine ligase family 2(GCS2)